MASGAALLSELDEGAYVTSTDHDVTFLEPADDDLHAEAEVVRIGEPVSVVRTGSRTRRPRATGRR